jgi:hypothetical protein
MRRSFVRRLAVLFFVVSTVVPALAAPRRDFDGPIPGRFLDRFVDVVKRVIVSLDDVKATIPLP